MNNLTLLDHPLIRHALTLLRAKDTQPAVFRQQARLIGLQLALASTASLPEIPQPIETPLEPFDGTRLGCPLVVAPILRAGLSLVDPFTELFPEVSVACIGLERDHETAEASSYYCKLPSLSQRRTICVDPMLATGGSAIMALNILKKRGADDLVFACVVAAPEGVDALTRAHPDVPIISAALDRCLNDRKYILPGLGDFGDRLYGT